MKRRLVAGLLLALTGLALSGTSASATPGEPQSFCLGNQVFSWDVASTEPQWRDTIQFFGTGALVQHSITIERHFNPVTMRGAVSGTIGATGPVNHTGTLHGVITPQGMSGTIRMTRVNFDDGTMDTFLGRWTAEGHPTDPAADFMFCFEGRYM